MHVYRQFTVHVSTKRVRMHVYRQFKLQVLTKHVRAHVYRQFTVQVSVGIMSLVVQVCLLLIIKYTVGVF